MLMLIKINNKQVIQIKHQHHNTNMIKVYLSILEWFNYNLAWVSPVCLWEIWQGSKWWCRVSQLLIIWIMHSQQWDNQLCNNQVWVNQEWANQESDNQEWANQEWASQEWDNQEWTSQACRWHKWSPLTPLVMVDRIHIFLYRWLKLIRLEMVYLIRWCKFLWIKEWCNLINNLHLPCIQVLMIMVSRGQMKMGYQAFLNNYDDNFLQFK